MAPAGTELYIVIKNWDSVADTAGLRQCVQKLSGATALPSVIVRGAQGAASAPFAVISRAAHATEEKVVCTGTRVGDAQAAFEKNYASGVDGAPDKRASSRTMMEFQTESDRPGLLADVSALFRSHNVNINFANITTHNKGRMAKHVYEFTDMAKVRRFLSQPFQA